MKTRRRSRRNNPRRRSKNPPRLEQSSIIRPDVIRAFAKMDRYGYNRKNVGFWYDRILRRYQSVYSGGGSFGWDWATMRGQNPEVYDALKYLESKYNATSK